MSLTLPTRENTMDSISAAIHFFDSPPVAVI